MNSKKLTAWDRVLLARKADRPKSLDYINLICDEPTVFVILKTFCFSPNN